MACCVSLGSATYSILDYNDIKGSEAIHGSKLEPLQWLAAFHQAML